MEERERRMEQMEAGEDEELQKLTGGFSGTIGVPTSILPNSTRRSRAMLCSSWPVSGK